MRLIDADALCIPSEEINAKMAVACAPVIDAVPVVRCEECIFRNDHRCMRHRIDILNLDFFCSDGLNWSEDIEK